jgi:Protein of unknown function (DUF3307)
VITLSPLSGFVLLLLAHWVGDFVLQSQWQATNKSKRLDALALHVAIYSAVLLVAAVILLGAWRGVVFTLVNAALHFATDFVTSRVAARFWEQRDWHRFFVMLGFDQFVHHATLAATLMLALR